MMMRFAWLTALMILPVLSAAAGPATPEYFAEVEKFRQDLDADIRTGGWLDLVGRVKIREGISTLGSESGSAIALPAPSPMFVGTLARRGELFEFEPAGGATVSIDDRAVTSRNRAGDEARGGKDQGGRSVARGSSDRGRLLLNIEDPNSPAIAAFKGTTWFRVDPSYRVVAQFLAYEKPQVTLALTFESASKSFASTGDVAFQLAGQSLKLKTLILGDELFVIFQDATNGVETYGGGRFLMAPLPENGVTTLDLNKAFNPYCAVNPYVLCPLLLLPIVYP